MRRALKALSVLLGYPTRELQDQIDAITGALGADGALSAAAIRSLAPLLIELRDGDIYELEERYVGLFDRSRNLSLNLFEHVHGESRDRGGAMVNLLETYRAGGVEPAGAELPDHLPTLLEFLSLRPAEEARATLVDAAHIIEALKLRLERRESAYASALGALVHLCATRPDTAAVAALAAAPEDDPDDLEALDQVWEESAVTFGPDPGAGCPTGREMLARMQPPRVDAPARSRDGG